MIQTYIGIDVSKSKLDICVLHNGEYTYMKCTNNESAFLKWLNKHKEIWNEKTVFVVESTGRYHWAASLVLSEQGCDVRVINPLITRQHQLASIRNTKTDKIDAQRLAKIGQDNSDLLPFGETRESLGTKRYQTIIRKLDKLIQQLQGTHRHLKASCDLLGDLEGIEGVEETINQMKELKKRYKKLVEQSACEVAQKLAKEVSGVSLYQATTLVNTLKGRHFDNRDKLVAFFGMDIMKRESGNYQGRGRLSKRGDGSIRMMLYHISFMIRQNEPVYKEYFEKKKAEGKHYTAAMMAIARKFLRFLFAFLSRHHVFSFASSQ